MKEAYKCKSADKARKRFQALVSWLERNGYDEAAGIVHQRVLRCEDTYFCASGPVQGASAIKCW